MGYACGICSRCGKEIYTPRPADVAVCDCWEYCPMDHGRGPYGTLMQDYTPDLTPNTYGPITGDSIYGDLDHPINILKRCPICGYVSAQLPMEVNLS